LRPGKVGTARQPRHPLKRLAVALFLAALSLAASVSQAGAAVTIGQLAPVNSPPVCVLEQVDRLHPTVTSGNSYVVPGTGTITSWSHNATVSALPAQLTMKVFRKVADPSTYSVVAFDARVLTNSTTNTFPTNFPVKPGDVLGSSSLLTRATACYVFSAGFPYLSRSGNLFLGQTGTFTTGTGLRLNISAVFEPTNTFTLGVTTLNKKKGTATLTVTVPNPGELTALCRWCVKAANAGAVTSKTVTAPGAVKLLIKAKGKKKRKLNATGKVKVKPKISYTPTGGDASTQSIKVKLKKKL
jgi:hypothetical protein